MAFNPACCRATCTAALLLLCRSPPHREGAAAAAVRYISRHRVPCGPCAYRAPETHMRARLAHWRPPPLVPAQPEPPESRGRMVPKDVASLSEHSPHCNRSHRPHASCMLLVLPPLVSAPSRRGRRRHALRGPLQLQQQARVLDLHQCVHVGKAGLHERQARLRAAGEGTRPGGGNTSAKNQRPGRQTARRLRRPTALSASATGLTTGRLPNPGRQQKGISGFKSVRSVHTLTELYLKVICCRTISSPDARKWHERSSTNLYSMFWRRENG